MLDPSDAIGLGLTLCFHLSDPAGAQPHRLLYAPLTGLVSSVRDTLQPLHRAGGALFHLHGTKDVHGAWRSADPFPGEMLLGLLPKVPSPPSTPQGLHVSCSLTPHTTPAPAVARWVAVRWLLYPMFPNQSRGTDARARSGVQAPVSQNDSELSQLALG